MSGRLLALTTNDVRLQYRYGIYIAYGFVVAFYLLVLTNAGPYLPAWAMGAIIYSDPAAVGFFFLGALMMLERAERVRGALAAAPVSGLDYFAAKAVTLGSLSLISTALLLLVRHDAANPALLLVAVLLTSICWIGIGVPVAQRFRTVNGYLVGAGALLTPVIAPTSVALMDPMPLWFGLWPPVAQLRLILVATGYGTATTAEIIAMLAIATVAAGAAAWLATRSLKGELGK